MQFTDAVAVAGTRRREDGSLIADARIARTGIQLYRGAEIGKPEMEVVRAYRPGSEVFSEDTLKSAAHRPVTNDHPPELVTSANWKRYSVGQSADEVVGEGIYVRVPLMVSDEAAIKAIEDGKRELSAGYTCEFDFTPGVTDAGEAYDAVQRSIRLNHIAIVTRGRAGPEVRIGDGAAPWGATPIHTADEKDRDMPELRTVMVDGLSVSTTDQGAQAIEKLTKDRDDARQALATAEAGHKTALAAKDTDLAKKDAEIDDLKGKALDAAALDKLVSDRSSLIATAKAIAPDVKTDGLTDADIRKAVVKAKVGDAAIADKSADYIDARFDILAEAAGKKDGADPVRDALKDPANDGKAVTSDGAYAEMVARQTSAWKGEQAKGAA
jgi:hypothetical protein